LLARKAPPRFAFVAAIACAIQLAPLGAPLLLSTDAWTYWDYGRLAAVHDKNPYRDNPETAHADPAFRYIGAAWRDTTSVYGPAFTLASEPIARAAGTSADAAAWIYKAAAAAAVLAAAFLAARLSRRPALALAFVGWNPLLAIHFAGGGHNDAWAAALVLGALAAGAARRPQLAGVCWALGILVKWIPLVLLPLRALEARAQGRRVGHLGFALTAIVTAALATWRYGFAWLNAIGPLTRNANTETRYALPHRLSQLGVPHGVAIAVFAAAFVVAYAWLLREAWRGRARLGLATGLLLLVTPYLVAWYVVWTLPLAAAEDDEPAALLGLVLCAYLMRQTVPV
jgi:alpha-1,6-mannosyltransferase